MIDTILQLLTLAFGLTVPESVARALATVSTRTGADVYLLAAVAMKESACGTFDGPHLLTGAHIFHPCAEGERSRRDGRCYNRSSRAQLRRLATTVGTCRTRRTCTSWLRGWRCGPDPVCRSTIGVQYAADVWSHYDRLTRAVPRVSVQDQVLPPPRYPSRRR